MPWSLRMLYISKYRQPFHLCITVKIKHTFGNSGPWKPLIQETAVKLLVLKRQLFNIFFSLQAVLILEWHGRNEKEMVIFIPKVSTLHVLEVTLIYFSPIRGQIIVLKVLKGSHHCTFSLQTRYITRMFSYSHHAEASPVLCKIYLPFEAICSLQWQGD